MTLHIASLLAGAKFDAQGLLPVVAQDATTGVLRMMAYANEAALKATAETGLATFWSRSRGQLWQKGGTSGNVLRVREIRLDCDGDGALYLVDAEGPSCHTGRVSCFFQGEDDAGPVDAAPAEPPAVILSHVARVIAARRQESAERSYVASLLGKGLPKINAKIAEESREVTEALVEGDHKHIVHEAADVLFHLLVGLEATSVPVEDVFAELRRRFGTSGHVEKASRPKPATSE